MSVRESPIFFVATGTAAAESVALFCAEPVLFWAQAGFVVAVAAEFALATEPNFDAGGFWGAGDLRNG